MGHKKKGAIVSGRRWFRPMPALNFQPRFADMVESGQKTQTIRKTLRGKVGDTVYLYTGQRTKNCRKLGEGRIVSIQSISIQRDVVFLGDRLLSAQDNNFLAAADGFADSAEMFDWFETVHGLPFDGFLYKWVKTG